MPSVHRKRINISLLIPFLVITLVFSALIWKKYQSSREMPPKPQLKEPIGARKAVLFFVADGSRLAREARELEPCDGAAACVKVVLDELFNGPVGDLDEALPEGVALKGVQIDGDIAVVDLNQNFGDELPKGSSAEMLAVYSIVDTVCANFPLINRVKLNIEGKSEVALRHLDLSSPLTPDYSLERGPIPDESEKVAPPTTSATKKGQHS